jgi:hypothetical protein
MRGIVAAQHSQPQKNVRAAEMRLARSKLSSSWQFTTAKNEKGALAGRPFRYPNCIEVRLEVELRCQLDSARGQGLCFVSKVGGNDICNVTVTRVGRREMLTRFGLPD